MAGKSIMAKAYKKNEFEKTKDYLNLNFKYLKYSIGSQCVLLVRYLVILKRHSWCDMRISLQKLSSRASTRQGLLFRQYKSKLTNNVNSENGVKQSSRANASEGEDHNIFQIINSNPNPKQ